MQTQQSVFSIGVILKARLRIAAEYLGTGILRTCILACSRETLQELANECATLQGKILEKTANGKTVKVQIYKPDKDKAASDPTGRSFDITFLSKILELLKGEHPVFFNDHICKISRMRNSLFHKVDFFTQKEYDEQLIDIESVAKNLISAAEQVAAQVKTEIENMTQVNHTRLNEIKDGILELLHWKTEVVDFMHKIRTESIEEGEKRLFEYLKVNGQEELNKLYDNLIFMNPVDFFIGTKNKTVVTDIYTELSFYDNDNCARFPHQEVLNELSNDNSNIILEGVAGSGKTTFLRYIRSLRISNQLLNDRILIHFDCRNDQYSNLKELLSTEMPKANSIFSAEQLKYGLISLKPIFIVDGIDEMNDNSRLITEEIIDIVKRGDATIFATSRPEGVKSFMRYMSNIDYKYLLIIGIPLEKQPDIISKYINVFSSAISVSPSVKFVKERLKIVEQSLLDWKTNPLIFCLLIYLIINDKKFNEDISVSSIYSHIMKALCDKLKGRIFADKKLPEDEIDMMVEEFFELVTETALKTLEKSEFNLTKVTARNVSKKSKQIFEHFREDALSSFFVCKGYITATGLEMTYYSFPHRSFQEYLAARAVGSAMIENDQYQIGAHVNVKLMKNITFMSFILGIMSLEERLEGTTCEEIIDYIILERDAATNSVLSGILRESLKNKVMAEALAKKMPNNLFIRIDDNLETWINVLKYDLSYVRYIEIEFIIDMSREHSDLMKVLLNLIKMKDLEVSLRFMHDAPAFHSFAPIFINPITDVAHGPCGEYLQILTNSRCKIKHLRGCFEKADMASLLNSVAPSGINIQLSVLSKKDAEAVCSLANILLEAHEDTNISDNNYREKILVNELDLSIFKSLDILDLPEKFILPTKVFRIDFVDFEPSTDEDEWMRQILDKIPKNKPSCLIHIVFGKFTMLQNKKGFFTLRRSLKDIYPLMEFYNAKPDDMNFWTKESVSFLPSYESRIRFYLACKSDIEAYHMLRKRMLAAKSEAEEQHNIMKPLKINSLHLECFPFTSADDLGDEFVLAELEFTINFNCFQLSDKDCMRQILDKIPKSIPNRCRVAVRGPYEMRDLDAEGTDALKIDLEKEYPHVKIYL